jgi:membrane-associated progesterone receptor component
MKFSWSDVSGSISSSGISIAITVMCIYVLRVFVVPKRVAMTRSDDQNEDDETFPDPMPKGDLTMAALRAYDGSDPTKPILLAAKGIVFDVTRGRDFYGKGGPYNAFTGIDCSRALGKVSLEKENLCADVRDFAASERDALNQWVAKFEDKYPVVGRVTDGKYNGKF